MADSPRFDAEALRALAAFLPQFEAADFEFGEWMVSDPSEDGVIPFPSFHLSPVALDFVSTCHEVGWIQWPEFDWVTWTGTAEAVQLHDDPAKLERAAPQQLSRLLTVLVRQDRFVEGALGAGFDSGFLLRILRRIATLAANPLT